MFNEKKNKIFSFKFIKKKKVFNTKTLCAFSRVSILFTFFILKKKKKYNSSQTMTEELILGIL